MMEAYEGLQPGCYGENWPRPFGFCGRCQFIGGYQSGPDCDVWPVCMKGWLYRKAYEHC